MALIPSAWNRATGLAMTGVFRKQGVKAQQEGEERRLLA